MGNYRAFSFLACTAWLYNRVMKKRWFLSFSCLPLLLSISGCSFFSASSSNYEDDIAVKSAYHRLYNYNEEYSIQAKGLTTYYVNNGSLPYVDISTFISSLEGLYQTKYISYSTPSERKLVVAWRSQTTKYTLTVDDEKNTITASSMTFFDLVYSTSGTNYSFALKTIGAKTTQESPKTFDLGAYGIEIYRKKGLVLIPFCVANSLFCSSNYYNFYFNGNAYYGTYFGFAMDSSDALEDSFKNSSWYGGSIPNDIASMNAKHFLFVMDNYYGLKDYYKIDSFASYLGDEVVNRLSSTNEENARSGFYTSLFEKLDELHTSFDYYSFFCSSASLKPAYGPVRTSYLEESSKLKTAYASAYPDDEPVRFYEDTAIIVAQSPIQTGASSELHDDNGNLKEDAYKKDSFYYMKEMLSRIEKHGGIKNVLLDMSRNGGGNMGATFRMLGIMNDKDIVYGSTNRLSGSGYAITMKVDANEDGSYDDEDAYGFYNWGILTSAVTFSAANYLACNASYSGAAKIYGERSGGGACPIVGFVNADGSSFHMSGPSMLQCAEVKDDSINFKEVQSGAALDKELSPDYFYGHDDILDALFD